MTSTSKKPGSYRRRCYGGASSWWYARLRWLRVPLRIFQRVALAFVLVFSLPACDERIDQVAISQKLEKWGLLDQEAKPRRFLILCDPSLLAPCSPETLARTLDAVLPAAGAEAGSPVEVWMLGSTSVGDTHSLGEQISPRLTETREQARKQKLGRWQEEAKTFFLKAAEAQFSRPHPKRSVLAESITKLALAHDHQLPTELILISDGREVSSVGGDLECGAPPSSEAWTKRLQRRSILGPGTLTNTKVSWSFVSMGSKAPRCATKLKQELAVRELWQRALSEAGAAKVVFLSGPVVLQDDRPAKTLARRE
jgi:hypothetical protein